MGRVKNIAAYIVLILVFQETLFRITFPLPELSNFDRALFVPKKNEFQGGFVRNKSFEWWSVPDTSSPFLLEYNKYGFRDTDWSVTKPEGKSRVMFVGDSFVEGIMSSQEQTIPKYFQRYIGSASVETINAGMLGTGIQEYLQFIADAVPVFRPDVVVLTIYANDFDARTIDIPSHYLTETYFDPWIPRLIELVRQFQQGNPVPSRFKFATTTVLPDSSQMTYPFKGRISEMYEHADSNLVEAMLKAQFNPYKLNEVMRMEQKLRQPCDFRVPLDFFRYYSEKFDFKPVVVYIPCRHQITDKYLQFEYPVSKKFNKATSLQDSMYQMNAHMLSKNCKLLGLKLVNTTDTLRLLESRGQGMYWSYDDHMRGVGYEAVAHCVARSLL